MVGETLGQAVVDTGCPHTVSGKVWIESHINTLSRKDRLSIRTKESHQKFRFGDGTLYPSRYHAIIPIYIANSRYELGVEVVDCEIPLLLSRDTLCRAKAKIDIGTATICFMGATIPLNISSSGHMCLPICRSLDSDNSETRKVLSRVLFSTPMCGVDTDLKTKARKLHLQFCHPNSDRLIDLVKKAGTSDQKIFDAIQEVTATCDVCIRNRKAPLRPAVGFPIANEFNHTVAMDLKSFHPHGYILHMIDHLTRYSSAVFITNKRKETIVKNVLDYWIRIFGSPKSFLTDNGGEFVNQDFVDLAEKFNVNLKTTAAEAAWSNGLCERHNGILANTIKKVMESSNCSIDVAVHWAVAAKNSLANVYGFSPNMLVFGRNPNYPNGFINLPPANNTFCLNDYVAENLRAMHAARQSFIQQESAERLRRALNRKSRTYANTIFCQGDKVLYWRNDQSECHGPGLVIGQDGQQILVKHGGSYIRIHPCRLQHWHAEPNVTKVIESTKKSSVANEKLLSDSSSSDEENYGFEDEPSLNNEEPDVHPTSENDSHSEWITVNNKRDLPKVNTMVQCRFPNDNNIVSCKILSKAGKSSTGNWHFLNIQKDDQPGKCFSFKGVQWKTLDEKDDDKGTDEIFFGETTDDHVYDLAKAEELDKWKSFKTYEEVPDNGQKSISTKWVCTRKIKGGSVYYKARLVARGFEENSEHLKKDSPTCSKESLRISLAIISCYKWKLHSIDIKSAFLQGNPMEREVYIKPPKEAKTTYIWKMLRCPYGLADAGRSWYLRLKNELVSKGMLQCKYDQAVFTWFEQGKLSGVLLCHVDDIMFGGSEQFHTKVIAELKMIFVCKKEFLHLGVVHLFRHRGRPGGEAAKCCVGFFK